jgi:hypothetical protein
MDTTNPLRRLAIVALASVLVAAPALAERKLVKDENGIKVEEEAVAGRSLPILFGTTTMAASPARIAEWIQAVHTYTDWQHNCEEARVLPQPDGTTLTYNRVGAPWPVSDRDVVLTSTREDGEGGTIRLGFSEADAANAPQDTGAVRMPRLRGSYELTPNGNGTLVVYRVDSDPGGSLPSWLMRQASTDLPFETLSNLRTRVEAGPPPKP